MEMSCYLFLVVAETSDKRGVRSRGARATTVPYSGIMIHGAILMRADKADERACLQRIPFVAAMAETPAPSEEETFWNMEPTQDGNQKAAEEAGQGHEEDDRGGKWARDQGNCSKGRNNGRGGGSYAQQDASSKKRDQRWGNGGGVWNNQERTIADLRRQVQALQK